MPTIKYRLSSRVQNGKAEVLARFYDGKFSQRAKTRIAAPVSAWNVADGQLTIPHKITPESVSIRETQRKLDELSDAVYSRWWSDRFDAQDGWLQRVIDEFHGRNAEPVACERMSLVDCISEYVSSKDLTSQSVAMYWVVASAIRRFEDATNRTLYTDSLSADDVQSFADWLATDEGITRSRNTVSARMKKLSAVCRFAVSKGYMQSTPFGDGKYKIPMEVYGDPIYLTLAERNRLYAFQGLPPALAAQRDIFVFQCHVGCRVSDLLQLTSDNVTDDGFLQYIQHKMRKERPVVVRLPLSDTALEIVNRYKGQPGGKLLPFVSSQKYNEYIHEMLRISCINRIVMVQDPKTLRTVPKKLWEVASSHMARRTFMANLFKETKSERITSAFTGHADGSRAFSRYTQVDDDMKLDVLKNMHERN